MGEKNFDPFSIQNNCQNDRKLNEIVARWSSYFSQAYQSCDEEEFPVSLKDGRKWDISSQGSKGRPPSIVLLGDEMIKISSFRLGFLRMVSKQTFAFRCQYVFNLKGTTISEYESKIEFLSSFSVNAKLDMESLIARRGYTIEFSECKQFDNDVCLEFPTTLIPIKPTSGVFFEYAEKCPTFCSFNFKNPIKSDFPSDFVHFYIFPIINNSLLEFYRKDFPVENNFAMPSNIIRNFGTW